MFDGFFYKNSPDADPLYEDFVKKLKGRGDFENHGDSYLRNITRWMNKKYIEQLNFSVTQNVVIKIAVKGSTKRHALQLLNYISRNSNSLKSEPESIVFDQNNEIVPKEAFEQITEDWSRDFDGFKISQEDEKIIENIDMIRSDLNDKFHTDGLNEEQGEFLQAIKKYETAKFQEDIPYNGALFEEKNNGDVGIIVANEYKENADYFCISNYPIISKKIKPLEELKPLNRDIRKMSFEKPKNFTHMILSAGGDNPNQKAVLEATKDFLEENIKSKGFEYAYTLHNDTKNPHVHVVVNNHSKQNDYKFCLSKHDLQEMRFDYTRHLDGYGVNRTALLKYDRKNSLQIIEKTVKNNENYNMSWYEYKLNDKKDKDFDLLKFKKKFLATSDSLVKKLEYQGFYDMAQDVKKQAKTMIETEKINIGKVVENTMQVLEKDERSFREYHEKSFRKGLGIKSDYKKNPETEEKMLEHYQKDLVTTQEDLQKLNKYNLSPELQGRLDKAIDDNDRKIEQLDKKLGSNVEKDKGFSRGR